MTLDVGYGPGTKEIPDPVYTLKDNQSHLQSVDAFIDLLSFYYISVLYSGSGNVVFLMDLALEQSLISRFHTFVC